MNSAQRPACPQCGSHQLISCHAIRRVFINRNGERIPLLTVHHALDHPVIEERVTLYTCICQWSGYASELSEG